MEAFTGTELHPLVRELVDDANFAAVSTILPSGRPQTHIVWVDYGHDHLLINTPADSQKHTNVIRDPRVTVMIWDHSNPFRYVEVRGEVTATTLGDQAWTHINQLSRRYGSGDYPFPRHDRAVLAIAPGRQLVAAPPRPV